MFGRLTSFTDIKDPPEVKSGQKNERGSGVVE
jgi:hypothetical protein